MAVMVSCIEISIELLKKSCCLIKVYGFMNFAFENGKLLPLTLARSWERKFISCWANIVRTGLKRNVARCFAHRDISTKGQRP